MNVPLSVPLKMIKRYEKNYQLLTRQTDKLFLMAGDQKVEHLNGDFVGTDIDPSDATPSHLFEIASTSPIGCLAVQYGLACRYGRDYPQIPYLIKMNSKTNLVPVSEQDPVSLSWVTINDVVRLHTEHKLNICGIGYTIYLGSKYENEMLREISQLIIKAHREGLIVVLWIYPRGEFIKKSKVYKNEKDPKLLAGAVGVANALGADFVKINLPDINHPITLTALTEITQAAGNTGVIIAGGSSRPTNEFLDLVCHLNKTPIRGIAVGRNIHQKSLNEATNLCEALASIIYGNKCS